MLLLRCRLSNRIDRAEEFTARDGPSLRAGCARALTRYYDAIRTSPTQYDPIRRYDSIHRDGPVALELQVRPLSGGQGLWNPLTDVRDSDAGAGTLCRNRRVQITAHALDHWPDDEWALLWEQCVASRQWDAALHQLTSVDLTVIR